MKDTKVVKPTVADISSALASAKGVQGLLTRYMLATTKPHTKTRKMFVQDVLHDAGYVVSALQIILQDEQ